MAKNKRVGPRTGHALFAVAALFLLSGACRAQNPDAPAKTATSNAVVKSDSLDVYREMSISRAATQSLKKGDAVIIDFEFQAAERWCSIRLPSETTRLGYVECQSLERTVARTSDTALGTRGTMPSSAAIAKALPPNVPLPRSSARAIAGYDQIASLAVREGSIDAVKMTEFDTAARSGSPEAMSRAALAHFAAGTFELNRSSIEQAIEQFESSLNYSASRPELQIANLLILARIDIERSQYSAALDYLGKARRVAPGSAGVAQLSGWAYYGLNQIDDAIKEWQAAQQIQATPEVAQALAKAQRDKSAESQAREVNNSHFNLRYQGSTEPDLAREILSTLENDFRDLQSEFHFTPPEPIGVVLYTEHSFRDVIELPAWAGAGNDGRIRVPVQGLTSVSDGLASELRHELVHSFVRQKTLGRCPGWLNEGLAQWFEGRRSGANAGALVATYDNGKYIPLQHLEGSWANMPGPTASFAYAWSLANVEYIMSSSGMWGIERLFARFDVDPAFEAALRGSLQMDYAELELQTVAYLRQMHGQ